MSNAKRKSADYDVGYGKPPKHTQFRPGKSGNPGGRPVGSRSFASIRDEVLLKPLKDIKLEGDISAKEALVIKGLHDAMNRHLALAKAIGFFNDAQEDQDGPREIEVRLILEEDDEEESPSRFNPGQN